MSFLTGTDMERGNNRYKDSRYHVRTFKCQFESNIGSYFATKNLDEVLIFFKRKHHASSLISSICIIQPKAAIIEYVIKIIKVYVISKAKCAKQESLLS